jgi:hypothetical protein
MASQKNIDRSEGSADSEPARRILATYEDHICFVSKFVEERGEERRGEERRGSTLQ